MKLEFQIEIRKESSDSIRTTWLNANCESEAYDLSEDLLEDGEDVFSVTCIGEIPSK
jgi:hypothetical protein